VTTQTPTNMDCACDHCGCENASENPVNNDGICTACQAGDHLECDPDCSHPQHQIVTPTGLSLADEEHDGLAKTIAQIEREAIIIAVAVERGKAEILADVAKGVVPGNVRHFAELHSYVDANGYGGLFDIPVELGLANAIQNALDGWLQKRESCSDCSQPALLGGKLCAGHQRLMTYTPHEAGGGIAANE
jgi:hypothetical protein